jgi:hypothetical protein
MGSLSIPGNPIFSNSLVSVRLPVRRVSETRFRRKHMVIVTICIIAAASLAVYTSLQRPAPGTVTNWVVYSLTKSGNHTQIQATYSNGVVTSQQQLMWLNFDNKTAVHNYFECTPSMTGCTLDGCPFTVLNDTNTEYRVKVTCGPIAKSLLRV